MASRGVYSLLRPVAKRVVHRAMQPVGPAKVLYDGLFSLEWYGREAYEWVRRSLVATPAFLSQCAVYGTNISVDRIPYISTPLRIELGSNIRISGEIGIAADGNRDPVLKIGDGCFIAHGTTFAVGRRIDIGNMVSIGNGSFISDTEGHARRTARDKSCWDTPAGEDDIAPVVIEDFVSICRNVMILKGVRIGARSIIGSGSVVRADIPPDSIVVGNPARVVKRREITLGA